MKSNPMGLLKLILELTRTLTQTDNEIHDTNETQDEYGENDSNEDVKVHSKYDGRLGIHGRGVAVGMRCLITAVSTVIDAITCEVFGDAKCIAALELGTCHGGIFVGRDYKSEAVVRFTVSVSYILESKEVALSEDRSDL